MFYDAADLLALSTGLPSSAPRRDGTYRIQSLHYQLLQAEEKVGIPHVDGRGLHGFRRMVAGDIYEVTGNVHAAMEFIGDTSKMMEHYILRRMPRMRATVDAADAARKLDAARKVA